MASRTMAGVQAARSLPPEEAANRLGVHYTHLMRLLRGGEIETAENGEVSIESLNAYMRFRKPPPDHISAAETAQILGIMPRHVYCLVAEGVLPGVLLPRAHGGAWALRPAVLALDRAELAKSHGIKVKPPEGWLTSGDACRLLGCSRSTLRWLVVQGLVEKWYVSPANIWYRREHVETVRRTDGGAGGI